MYCYLHYEPKEDISNYELARLVGLLMVCSLNGGNFTEYLQIRDENTYNDFLKSYADILRHFRVEFMENEQ